MDDTINRAIIYGNCPPKGVYFTVMVEYNSENPIFDGQMAEGETLVSNPVRSFPEAMELSEIISTQLQREKFVGSHLIEVNPDDTDGFHYFITDVQQDPIARIGIETTDTRNQTFH